MKSKINSSQVTGEKHEKNSFWSGKFGKAREFQLIAEHHVKH